ncbi:MAG: TetR family transcriptional regulator [Candidatus Methanomethylophilus sp.]|nr:TetR family transcriptional regulator [Methanomethylophilus sp.]
MKPYRRARTEEQIADRCDGIIAAAADIYACEGYDAVTFQAIASQTPFTRPSIYRYFQTREEVMLELLRRDYAGWYADLQRVFAADTMASREEFCRLLAGTIGSHQRMLALISINLRAIETESRPERLQGFKRLCRDSMAYLLSRVAVYFPRSTVQARDDFSQALMVMFFGLYPNTHLTSQQIAAMDAVGMSHKRDFDGLCYRSLLLITSEF